jgi:membrane associated rhomboid family serine protease
MGVMYHPHRAKPNRHYVPKVVPIPLSDENPTRHAPVMTVTLIVANTLAWLYELSHGVQLSVLDYGLIPAWFLRHISSGTLPLGTGTLIRLTQEVPWPMTVFSSMFMHGGWLHLIGNMWFLWIFGDNLEDRMGKVRFTLFYLLCGVAAAVTQILGMPGSTAPMVGASGAIAGVLGGYILLYPTARVKCLWFLFVFITTIRIPAYILLGLWFVSQFFTPNEAGVAWMAHVGGFLAGLALVKLFASPEPPPEPPMRVVWN